MKIRIRYFASFREIMGKNEETLTLQDGTRVADVRELLLSEYPRLTTTMERAICAVNRNYVPVDTKLQEGDELVFIPPVGGGNQESHEWTL